MSFRPRREPLGPAVARTPEQLDVPKTSLAHGVRPSPLDGRLTTSTGTPSLDSLLAGHAGLAIGTSLIVEESGTTDFGAWLLRYYAAEGIVQGHHVHVLGPNEGWGRELPGLASRKETQKKTSTDTSDKMKIAWRYERFGEFGVTARDRNGMGASSSSTSIFCHDFDLSQRLTLPSPSNMTFVALQPSRDFGESHTEVSPFKVFIDHLVFQLAASSPNTIHRVVIPSLLSPAWYAPHSCRPEFVLQFLHVLRALLRRYSTNLIAMITLPLTLYPRSTGLTRWMELLNDGVLELAPFPSAAIQAKAPAAGARLPEELPQGMFKVHRLSIFHERGGGGGEASGFGDDWAFTLSRRKGLVIKPFSLPPVDGDPQAQQETLEHKNGQLSEMTIEF